MSSHKALSWLFSLLLKHFFVDWWLQTEEEIEHKGSYLHPSGIKHSLKHSFATALVTIPFLHESCIVVGAMDGIVHYHIDWVKQNVTRIFQLSPKDKTFWILIGLDQLLHQLTYISIVWFYMAISIVYGVRHEMREDLQAYDMILYIP